MPSAVRDLYRPGLTGVEAAMLISWVVDDPQPSGLFVVGQRSVAEHLFRSRTISNKTPLMLSRSQFRPFGLIVKSMQNLYRSPKPESLCSGRVDWITMRVYSSPRIEASSVMPEKIACPGCKALLQVREGLAGKKVKCPKCGNVIQIPKPPE